MPIFCLVVALFFQMLCCQPTSLASTPTGVVMWNCSSAQRFGAFFFGKNVKFPAHHGVCVMFISSFWFSPYWPRVAVICLHLHALGGWLVESARSLLHFEPAFLTVCCSTPRSFPNIACILVVVLDALTHGVFGDVYLHPHVHAMSGFLVEFVLFV